MTRGRPSTTKEVYDILAERPRTAKELMDVLGVSRSVVNYHIERMRDRYPVHISEWRRTVGAIAPVYAAGEGVDAPKPTPKFPKRKKPSIKRTPTPKAPAFDFPWRSPWG